MKKIWNVLPAETVLIEKLKKDLGISPLILQLLLNRRISCPREISKFLNTKLSDLHGPFLLPDMERAVKRIREAQRNKEKALIFSDYDADGVTSLAILKETLDKIGLQNEYYLPHRLNEGYGLNIGAVNYAHNHRFTLVITLDCGISDFPEIEALNNFKIDTIVVDHHRVAFDSKLPPAFAIINPKRPDADYPFCEMAAVALSYKLSCALLESSCEDCLDIASIGTVADVVPLISENRVIVKEGLKRLNNTKRPGLSSLMEVAGIANKTVTRGYISYILAPRINAAGRLGHANKAFDLLVCQDKNEADILAKELHDLNIRRQRIESKIMAEAVDKIDGIDFSKERVIVLSQDGWHKGVIGIVAAKITDKYKRPAVIISYEGEMGKGSARSIKNFHLFESLSKCSRHLEDFGGHARAAGLSVLKKNLCAFRESMNRVAFETLKPEDLIPQLDIDLVVSLSDLGPEFISSISLLEPFGEANPEPVFASFGLKVVSRPSLLARDTLKFWVTDGQATYPAVGFGLAGYYDLVNSASTLDLAYKVSVDNWQGNNQLQLEIEDIRAPS